MSGSEPDRQHAVAKIMSEPESIIRILTDLTARDSVAGAIILVVGLSFALILPWMFLFMAYRINKARYYVFSLPLMKASDVYSGFVLLRGKAECSDPARSFLTGSPCVWYGCHVQEQWRKSIKTRYTDRKGVVHTKREIVYGWSPLYADEDSRPFELRDETGSIPVEAYGAGIEPVRTLETECGIDDPLYYAKGPEGFIDHSTRRRRFVEDVIPVQADLNIIGTATPSKDHGRPVLSLVQDRSLFMISTRSKTRFLKRTTRQYWTHLLCGLLIAAFPALFFLALSGNPVLGPAHLPVSTGLIVAYLFAAAIAWRTVAFHRLRKERRWAREARGILHDLLEARKTLIPELYRIASYYCDLDTVPEDERLELCGRLERGELTFDDLMERYPILMSGKIFLPLNKKLRNLEESIQRAGASYDAYAAKYNTSLHRFPGNIIHFICRMKPMPPFAQIDLTPYRPDIIAPFLSLGTEL